MNDVFLRELVVELQKRISDLQVEIMLERQATAHAIAERDRARSTAIALEQEIARVPVIGEAS